MDLLLIPERLSPPTNYARHIYLLIQTKLEIINLFIINANLVNFHSGTSTHWDCVHMDFSSITAQWLTTYKIYSVSPQRLKQLLSLFYLEILVSLYVCLCRHYAPTFFCNMHIENVSFYRHIFMESASTQIASFQTKCQLAIKVLSELSFFSSWQSVTPCFHGRLRGSCHLIHVPVSSRLQKPAIKIAFL